MDQLWGISISPIPYSELTSVTTFCPTALIKLRNFQTELKTFSCKPGLFPCALSLSKEAIKPKSYSSYFYTFIMPKTPPNPINLSTQISLKLVDFFLSSKQLC